MAASYCADRPLEALHHSRSIARKVGHRVYNATPSLTQRLSLSLSPPLALSRPPSIWFTAIAPVSQSLARLSTITLDIGTAGSLWQALMHMHRASERKWARSTHETRRLLISSTPRMTGDVTAWNCKMERARAPATITRNRPSRIPRGARSVRSLSSKRVLRSRAYRNDRVIGFVGV